MFIEKIKSDGLAHLSYLLGNKGEAAVIDPRRDCEIYLEVAARHGCRITRIFETHRNEDLVSGAPILAALTGARVYHGPNAAGDVTYAETIRDGAEFEFANLRLRVMETPGHTDDSLSFVLYDTASGEDALAVFTGDALFVGDVGRTDFYPDRAEEVAGHLFDSLQRIVSLGEQTLVYPAHGAGSVCGDNMADREFTTVGYELATNPMLRIADRDAFIARKCAEHHDQPPYFRLMERLNLEGARATRRVLAPAPLTASRYELLRDDAVTVDVRGVTAYLGGHVPGSLAIPDDMVPAFAGWLLTADEDLVLVAADARQAETATRHLARIGFDRVVGWLTPALTGWAADGQAFRTVNALDAAAVRHRIEATQSGWVLLDVRSKPEYEEDAIAGSRHIYVGELPARLKELDPQCRYTVMCESGARATIAASVLLRAGFSDVDVFLGSMGAWKAADARSEAA